MESSGCTINLARRLEVLGPDDLRAVHRDHWNLKELLRRGGALGALNSHLLGSTHSYILLSNTRILFV